MFSFGIISDIQYADHDDSLPLFPPFRTRYYRSSVEQLKSAIADFKSCNAQFMLQLGDLIDGKSRKNSLEALDKLLQVFRDSELPVYHTIGNHDLYNLSHQQAIDKILSSGTLSLGHSAYYSFVHNNFRFISLDSYDVAMLGRTKGDSPYSSAKKYLEVNLNSDLNSPDGLEGVNKRFVQYNGAIGAEQLAWLKEELKQAEEQQQTVVVFSK